MNTKVILGAQWGDEGKGKFVDYLAKSADLCVRYQGGDNAGHTIVVGDKVYKLRLIPSGILQGVRCVIGAGCVVNFKNLHKEISTLSEAHIPVNPDLLHIDAKSTIILPIYPRVDAALEGQAGAIGTTKNGIGVAYEDRAARIALRAEDFTSKKDLDSLNYRVAKIANKYAPILNETVRNMTQEILAHIQEFTEVFQDYIVDAGVIIHEAFQNKSEVIIEGAQGTLLDNVHGTYPYVTSSCTLAGGIEQSIGCALPKNTQRIGIIKAYLTRVGNGPFPTELFDNIGEEIAKKGFEVGTVTGRKRRCGWLDLDLLNYAHRLNGFDSLGITKADVLDGFEEVKLKVNNEILTFKGWKNIAQAKTLDDLDENFLTYIEFIEKEARNFIHYCSLLQIPLDAELKQLTDVKSYSLPLKLTSDFRRFLIMRLCF
ncbi:MAG: adenylosuccinate synthase [Chitinophagales bacterium]|nr:adenylosuccinate synthase [Chitinophagales bacterium]